MQPLRNKKASDLSLNGLEGLLGEDRCFESVQDWTVEETAKELGLSRGGVIRRLEDGILSGYKLSRGGAYVWRVRPLWLKNNSNNNDQKSFERAKQAKPAEPTELAEQLESNNLAGYSEHAGSNQHTEHIKQVEHAEHVEQVEHDNIMPETVSATIETLFLADTNTYKELIELKTKLSLTESQHQEVIKKLEAATYRIGYLEAQVTTYSDQLKSITQNEPTLSWWRRLQTWFAS